MLFDSLSYTHSKGKQQLSWPDMFITAELSQLSKWWSFLALDYLIPSNTPHAGLSSSYNSQVL